MRRLKDALKEIEGWCLQRGLAGEMEVGRGKEGLELLRLCQHIEGTWETPGEDEGGRG
jgi:hypothetical protein